MSLPIHFLWKSGYPCPHKKIALGQAIFEAVEQCRQFEFSVPWCCHLNKLLIHHSKESTEMQTQSLGWEQAGSPLRRWEIFSYHFYYLG